MYVTFAPASPTRLCSRRSRRAVGRTGLPGLLGLVLILISSSPGPAEACVYSQPPPPVCGKSLHVSAAVPQVVLLPGGGVYDLETLVYFTMVDFPAGAGACPSGPHTVDLRVTATCSSAGHGSGMLLGAALVEGFNELTVPVTIGAGPPRLCDLEVEVEVLLADGMNLTARSDTLTCLGDPAPGNPGVPRLDLSLLVPGAEIARVSPGDQASFTYRLTNNDPVDAFTGELAAESLNTARLPGASGPMPPGTGVFSISDPVEGDNFPLAFEGELFEGCVLLPLDPTDASVPMITHPIELDPGESMDLTIYSRPWGMCADGSCSRGNVTLSGDFSDLSSGLACAGFVTAVDADVTPSYQWPDAGEAPTAGAPASDEITLEGEPRPGDPRGVRENIS